jgi:hypothetical protein
MRTSKFWSGASPSVSTTPPVASWITGAANSGAQEVHQRSASFSVFCLGIRSLEEIKQTLFADSVTKVP